MKSRIVLSIIVCLFGLLLTAAAMIIEPSGEIHGSVLGALTMTLTYSAALLGIDMNLRKGKKNVTKTTKEQSC